MVCLRVNLCNNWCIFWLSETTKTLLGITLYTQGISFQTDAFREYTKLIETDWDAFETITIFLYFQEIVLDVESQPISLKQPTDRQEKRREKEEKAEKRISDQ